MASRKKEQIPRLRLVMTNRKRDDKPQKRADPPLRLRFSHGVKYSMPNGRLIEGAAPRLWNLET
jgi:hypothetical protein